MTNIAIRKDFSQIPNDFIDALPTLHLTPNQYKLCLKLLKISFGKSVFILTENIKRLIKGFLELKNWGRAQRVLNLLQEKELIFFKEVNQKIEVTFGKLLQFETYIHPDKKYIHPDKIDKTSDFAGSLTPPNTFINTSTHHVNKDINKNSFLHSQKNDETSKIKIEVNQIKIRKEGILTDKKNNEPIATSKIEKDIDTSSDRQTPIYEAVNDTNNAINIKKQEILNQMQNYKYTDDEPRIEINNEEAAPEINWKYLSALSNQMKQYKYTDNEIGIVKKEMLRATSKGISTDRIDEIAKAIIYNKIDKSPKNRPINDLRAFVISRLFSKDDKHIFQKLDHLKDFPYCEIKTFEEIQHQKQIKNQIEIVKVNDEHAKSVDAGREQMLQQETELKNKLKDDYQTKLETIKKDLQIKNPQWFRTPDFFAIDALYQQVFSNQAARHLENTEVDQIQLEQDRMMLKAR